jgi:hypothetical protein
MAFSNYTAFPTIKKPVARVFISSLFSDILCNSIESSGNIASTGFKQLFTGPGGVVLTPKLTRSKVGDQQRGTTDIIQDDGEYTLEINIAQISVNMLKDFVVMNPGVSGAQTRLSMKANRGTNITANSVSFLVYDKQFDPSNDTDTPAVTCDSEAIVVYKANALDSPAIIYNEAQGTAKIMFQCLFSKSTGSASGSAGVIGPLQSL